MMELINSFRAKRTIEPFDGEAETAIGQHRTEPKRYKNSLLFEFLLNLSSLFLSFKSK